MLVIALASVVVSACGGAHARPSATTKTGATAASRAATTRSPAAAARHMLAVQAVLARWRLPVARYRTMAAANGRYIFLLGGIDAAGSTVDSVYRLDPAKGTTRLAGTLATPTHGAAALLLGKRVFVFGGAGPPVYDLVQEYDPASGDARVVGHLPAAAAVGGQVVVAAGFDGVGPVSTVLATTDERHFRLLARLPQAVRYPAVAAVGNSAYLFGGLRFGGEYTGTFSRAIQRVELTTGQAAIVGRLPIPYAHAMATVRGGQVFILGGSTSAGSSSAILRFDPATGAVSRAGTLPEHVADGAVATIGDTTYVIGGINGGPLTTVCIVRIG
jgi:N-acetylneuraminic acid mutarotase